MLRFILRQLRCVYLSRSLKRFLPEVFPREQETERDIRLRAGPARGGNDEKEAVSPPRYGSAFRRLYGHAAYSVAAFLLRMCGGALKGSPLRELVGTFFEGIAFHPVSGGRGGGGGGKGGRGAVGGSGGTVPHAQLTDFAVMHLPDLLQCFSEVGYAGAFVRLLCRVGGCTSPPSAKACPRAAALVLRMLALRGWHPEVDVF